MKSMNRVPVERFLSSKASRSIYRPGMEFAQKGFYRCQGTDGDGIP